MTLSLPAFANVNLVPVTEAPAAAVESPPTEADAPATAGTEDEEPSA